MYSITTSFACALPIPQIVDTLQQAYDEGAYGSFHVENHEDLIRIKFDRDVMFDAPLLVDRIPNLLLDRDWKEKINKAAGIQLADEFAMVLDDNEQTALSGLFANLRNANYTLPEIADLQGTVSYEAIKLLRA